MVVRYARGEKAERVWGTWEVLETGETFCVKKLVVYPKQKLSLQTHEHRDEHWIVVQGKAAVTLGHEIIIKNPNESVFIPKKEFHRIESVGDENLVFIEVQTGALLDENDIIRYNDDYTVKA